MHVPVGEGFICRAIALAKADPFPDGLSSTIAGVGKPRPYDQKYLRMGRVGVYALPHRASRHVMVTRITHVEQECYKIQKLVLIIIC